MLNKLEQIISQLNRFLDEAEERADSDREATASRWADVPDALKTAIAALEEAAEALRAS